MCLKQKLIPGSVIGHRFVDSAVVDDVVGIGFVVDHDVVVEPVTPQYFVGNI
jgi:hypothetical protein